MVNVPTTASAGSADTTTTNGPASQATQGTCPADHDLVVRTRAGDNAACELLYQRYAGVARRFAAHRTQSPYLADDLVAEAFARLLRALRGGGGPDHAFRAYLLTTVRHLADEWGAGERRAVVVDDCERYLSHRFGEQPDPIAQCIERRLAARAFTQLPQRWQEVLWHGEIEGATTASIAARLGLSPGAVAALALRAREGLRQAYLRAHIGDGDVPDGCRDHVERLAALARGRLGRRQREVLERHLVECGRCRACFDEMVETNRRLCSIVATSAAESLSGVGRATT